MVYVRAWREPSSVYNPERQRFASALPAERLVRAGARNRKLDGAQAILDGNQAQGITAQARAAV